MASPRAEPDRGAHPALSRIVASPRAELDRRAHPALSRIVALTPR
nr:hypothetical protein [Actinoplanes polyasparticus]